MAQGRTSEKEIFPAVEEIVERHVVETEDHFFKESETEIVESVPLSNVSEDFDDPTRECLCIEVKKEANLMDGKEKKAPCLSFRLSHFAIVDSVLKETNINPHIEALLPFSLNSIYQKFINSKQYTENIRKKDEFYYGVGLLGMEMEKLIYNKRKTLDESLQRVFRQRSNLKHKRLRDGIVINRARTKSRTKFNMFTIGKDLFKKSHGPDARKSGKKKSIIRRAAAQKLELAKKALNEAYGSSDEMTENYSRSIALSRTKRQRKLPQLDFKYCYNDAFGIRARKSVNTGKVEQYMEITDSDSSSVIEVFPPGDKANSEYSDSGITHPRFIKDSNTTTSKYVVGARKQLRPRDSRALNLLDKLRLGLQCTVVQTEHEVIIHNLTLEDLSTLRSRLQGIATFKNIEAEYDKNGLETARVTIDRRVLNLPFKGFDPQMGSPLICVRKNDGPPKRKFVDSSVAADRKLVSAKLEDYCPRWARPKLRTVKKIRKLYTQSSNTPNILARPQSSIRSDRLSRTPDKQCIGMSQCHPLFPSSMVEVMNSAQAGTLTPASFYPQITSMSGNIITESKDSKIIKLEPFHQIVSASDPSFVPETSTSSLYLTARNVNVIPTHTCTDNVRTVITSSATLLPSNTSTPATAKSASQLLMLRKGGTQVSSESASPCISTISMNGNDLLFANQILKPFKKNIPVSSPSKLEIDEEETDFELTSSVITLANSTEISVKVGHSATNVHQKTHFLSAPLIKANDARFLNGRNVTGVLVNSRRAVHLSNSPVFHSLHPLAHSSTLPVLESSTLNAILSAASVTHASTQNSTALQSNPNPKVRHRKWTHNFLSSNSINFREVLCAVTQKSVPSVPICAPQTRTVAPVSQSTQDTHTADCHRPLSVPAKSSSVVLKSLLVGSSSANDLCCVNKAALWSSKFLATSLPDSKIKWQLGGSVVPCQPIFVTTVAKDNKPLDNK